MRTLRTVVLVVLINAMRGLHFCFAAAAALSKLLVNAGTDAPMYDVAIVGAGYAGLTAARRLAAKGHSVLVLEANNR
jgi:ribulose 1,5-bisphosphate synthetase/thiazole synthase